uniref:Putative secreted protein n=1 Tax=Ixodes ricinus TaxID=34613 RepID=A0A6B0UWU2_IXORI
MMACLWFVSIAPQARFSASSASLSYSLRSLLPATASCFANTVRTYVAFLYSAFSWSHRGCSIMAASGFHFSRCEASTTCQRCFSTVSRHLFSITCVATSSEISKSSGAIVPYRPSSSKVNDRAVATCSARHLAKRSFFSDARRRMTAGPE